MKHKSTLAFAFLFFSCYALNAQIEKGSILLGGTLGFNNSSQTGYYTSSNTNINPRVTYAIGKNSVIGLSGNVSFGTTKHDTEHYKTTNNNYGGSVFWRKYLPIQNRLGWYTELNGGIWAGKYKSTNTNGEQTSRSTTYGIGALPGVYFMALPKLVLSANVGGINFNRSISKSSGNADTRSSYLSVNFLSNFTFGIDFILGKKSAS